MCVSPITIPNPNYHSSSKLSYLVDTQSAFIKVPCGVCDECLVSKQMSLVQRCIMEATKNHLFFATLTYKDSMLPFVDVNGRSIRYADYHDLNNVIRRIRRHKLFPRDFRYFAVSELGSKNGRPHFHVLFFVPKVDGDDFNTCLSLESRMKKVLLDCWCRNIGSRKFPLYVPLCDYVRKFIRGKWRSNYDFHYVNPSYSENGVGDVAFYVLKYMLKKSDRTLALQRALRLNLSEDYYTQIWHKVMPRYWKSLDFGLSKDTDVVSSLRRGISLHKFDYSFPVFVNPYTGRTMPLSRFYKSKGSIYDLDTATHFALSGRDSSDDLSFTDMRRHSLRLDFLQGVGDSDVFDDSL